LLLLPAIPKHDYIVKTLKILSLKIIDPKNQNTKNLNNIVLYLLSVASKNPNITLNKNPNTILNPKNPKPMKKKPNTILNPKNPKAKKNSNTILNKIHSTILKKHLKNHNKKNDSRKKTLQAWSGVAALAVSELEDADRRGDSGWCRVVTTRVRMGQLRT
jgi:hypothetical protein